MGTSAKLEEVTRQAEEKQRKLDAEQQAIKDASENAALLGDTLVKLEQEQATAITTAKTAAEKAVELRSAADSAVEAEKDAKQEVVGQKIELDQSQKKEETLSKAAGEAGDAAKIASDAVTALKEELADTITNEQKTNKDLLTRDTQINAARDRKEAAMLEKNDARDKLNEKATIASSAEADKAAADKAVSDLEDDRLKMVKTAKASEAATQAKIDAEHLSLLLQKQ